MSDELPAEQVAYERWQPPSVDVPAGAAVGAMMTADRIEVLETAARKEGYEDGRREGLEAAQAEVAAKLDELQTLIRAIATPLAAVDEAVERELLTLAMTLARQIVRREMHLQPDEIVPVVREAVSALPATEGPVAIRLHPEDVELVREALGADTESDGWALRSDPELTRGDCIAECGLSQVDARLETRLNALFASQLMPAGSTRAENG